jgi:dienelactone hydrolase
VPGLLEHGYAVVVVDLRAFGESREEVAAPQDLDDFARANFHLDIVGAIAAVADHPRVDASRLAVAAAGFSVTPAVRAAREDSRIGVLVLLSGYLEAEEEEFLVTRPDLPVLLTVAAGDRRMASVARQHAKKLMGENQILFEFMVPAGGDGAAGADDADGASDAGWEGTDGLTEATGLGDLILWFLDEHVPR